MRGPVGMSAIGRLLPQLAVIGCFLGQLSADVDLGKNCHPEFYFLKKRGSFGFKR